MVNYPTIKVDSHSILQAFLIDRQFDCDVGELRVDFRVGLGLDGGVKARVFMILSDGADAGGSMFISSELRSPRRGLRGRTRMTGWQ